MNKRIAVLAGLLMATAVSAAIMDESSQHQVSSTEAVLASEGTSNADLLALWRQTGSNASSVAYARPQ